MGVIKKSKGCPAQNGFVRNILFALFIPLFLSACTNVNVDTPEIITFDDEAAFNTHAEQVQQIFIQSCLKKDFRMNGDSATTKIFTCKKEKSNFGLMQISEALILRRVQDKFEMEFQARRDRFGIFFPLESGYNDTEYFPYFCSKIKKLDGVKCSAPEPRGLMHALFLLGLAISIFAVALFFVRSVKRGIGKLFKRFIKRDNEPEINWSDDY